MSDGPIKEQNGEGAEQSTYGIANQPHLHGITRYLRSKVIHEHKKWSAGGVPHLQITHGNNKLSTIPQAS